MKRRHIITLLLVGSVSIGLQASEPEELYLINTKNKTSSARNQDVQQLLLDIASADPSLYGISPRYNLYYVSMLKKLRDPSLQGFYESRILKRMLSQIGREYGYNTWPDARGYIKHTIDEEYESLLRKVRSGTYFNRPANPVSDIGEWEIVD